MYKDDRFLSTIIQSNLTENLANVTEQYARNALFKANDLVKILHTKAVKLRSCKKKKSDKISAISDREATLALSSAHLLKSLLDKNFGTSPRDLRSIQSHDTSLLKLIEKAKTTSEGTFVLQRGILYKKGAIPGTFLLCLPAAVASISAFRLHNLFNFHLSHQHMMDQLQKIIYCPELNKIITDVIKTCPVCILAPTQTLFRQCGS